MILKQKRFQEGEKHTKSLFGINDEFKCFLLEDGHKDVKVKGETRIPAGEYEVTLRTEGGMHQKYLEKFGSEFHKGMLWIRNIENFKYVYIHIGNRPKDTDGCPLTGFSADFTTNQIGSSTNAYKSIYPTIAGAILSGERVIIKITDKC